MRGLDNRFCANTSLLYPTEAFAGCCIANTESDKRESVVQAMTLGTRIAASPGH